MLNITTFIFGIKYTRETQWQMNYINDCKATELHKYSPLRVPKAKKIHQKPAKNKGWLLKRHRGVDSSSGTEEKERRGKKLNWK